MQGNPHKPFLFEEPTKRKQISGEKERGKKRKKKKETHVIAASQGPLLESSAIMSFSPLTVYVSLALCFDFPQSSPLAHFWTQGGCEKKKIFVQ